MAFTEHERDRDLDNLALEAIAAIDEVYQDGSAVHPSKPLMERLGHICGAYRALFVARNGLFRSSLVSVKPDDALGAISLMMAADANRLTVEAPFILIAQTYSVVPLENGQELDVIYHDVAPLHITGTQSKKVAYRGLGIWVSTINENSQPGSDIVVGFLPALDTRVISPSSQSN